MPFFLTISLVALVLAVGFLSRETVRPLQELQEQVESLVQYRDGVLNVERADEIGQLGQAFAFLLDDRRRAEASLQESEEKYRTLVENLNVGIFQSTLDGTFLHANSAVIHMAGYADWDEFKGLPASFLYVDEADRARLIAELRAQGRVLNVETRSRKKDGTVYWITISAVLLKDHDGKPVSILGSVADITDRKRVEDALRESESIFASFMEYSPVYIFFKDKELRPLRLSRNYEQMLGMPVGQMLGKTLDELFPSDLAKSMIQDDLRILNEGQRVDVVEELGGRVYETTKFPIFKDGRPQMLAGFTVDITERRQAEIERENLITELSIKNAELERFTYTVSHDLKSPIVTIRGFLGYLAEDALSGNTPRMEKDIERITNATEKMQSLLHDLLELSRIGRMMNAPETIQLEDLVHDALDILHGQLEEGHITVLTQPDLPAVYGDRQRLTEVLQNLIDNAVKYMGDQTEPNIEIGQCGEESGRSIFFVRDNGMGIAPEYRERIFGLFNKLDPTSEGTGVGLALVKRIIEVHGGRIWVESALGKGSTFYFSLQKN